MAVSTKDGDQKISPAAHGIEDNASGPVLYMALGLGSKSWKLTFCGGRKRRQAPLPAGDAMKRLEVFACLQSSQSGPYIAGPYSNRK